MHGLNDIKKINDFDINSEKYDSDSDGNKS